MTSKGGAGDDYLSGEPVNDTLAGGAGDDTAERRRGGWQLRRRGGQ